MSFPNQSSVKLHCTVGLHLFHCQLVHCRTHLGKFAENFLSLFAAEGSLILPEGM